MKTLYFDTSYLFRVYSNEAGHGAVKDLLQTVPGVHSAWHARAEFASILLRKRREDSDSRAHLASLEAQFQQDRKDGLIEFLPLEDAVMLRIESTLRAVPDGTFLRAADALHLACAAEHGFRDVFSNDRHFLAAAPLFGLQGRNVIPD